MEVHLTPELETRLVRIANEQGRNSEALVVEAVERMVDYDEWFAREVERGIASAERGEFIEHEEIGRMINSRYPG